MRISFSYFIVSLLFSLSIAGTLSAQATAGVPDMSVAGVKLGDRESAKKFLDGYQPRTDEGTCTYYFYNSRATSVLKLTSASLDEPYFITALEVYEVGDDYRNRHFVAEKFGRFLTESNVFVGYHQSGRDMAVSLLVGIPNLTRTNSIGPNDILKKKGRPLEHTTTGKVDLLRFQFDDIKVPDSTAAFRYIAEYKFYKRELTRFSMKITPASAE